MSIILRLVPPSAIRFAGQLQFKLPILRPAINKIGQLLAGAGRIQRGAGRGLLFDASGCNPGYLAGTSEPLEQELVVRYSPPGKTVYDLGANAGFYALIAARAVGTSGEVLAFEPSPKLCERIRANAALNSLTNITVIEAAVSDVDGEIDFGIVSDLSVSNSIKSAASGNAIRVRSVTIDSISHGKRPPCLLLIDIEGAEVEAMQGAMNTITQFKPVIMVEVHWLGAKFLDFVDGTLKPLGYTISTYDGKEPPSDVIRYHAILLPSHETPVVRQA
jgi:FkbM family methyltransferase